MRQMIRRPTMSDLLEIVLEIVLEGALHGASSRRVPLVVRALLAAVLAALWLGLSGLLLYVGMQSGSIPLMFCGGCSWACGGILLADKIRRVRRR